MINQLKIFDIYIESEIEDLEGVILQTPGREVENIRPGNVERSLYSDILNCPVTNNTTNPFAAK